MSGYASFGPAGLSDSFGRRPSLLYPAWLREKGLDCFEYQCGRGVNIGEETARRLGEAAAAHGIALSVHSPYFINLSSMEERRVEKNAEYVLDSVRVAKWMGGDRVTIHCGGLSGLTREEAMANTRWNLDNILARLEAEGLTGVLLCIETMGKVNTIGSLEEVLALCAPDERLLPCIDFGHLNARAQGEMNSREDLARLLDAMENSLGRRRASLFHGHFSKIEYSKGGEIRHLTFEDRTFGPPYEPLMELLAQRGFTPRLICESAGTQAEDALEMKQYYTNLLEKS